MPPLPFDSLQKPATDGSGTPPQRHVQNFEGADGEQLHRVVVQTLQRDLVSYQTQQTGLQEMEMRLREMYTSPHLPVQSSACGTSPTQIPKMSKQIPVNVPGRDPGQLQMVNGEAPNRWGNRMLHQDLSMLADAYRGVLSPNLHPHTSTHLANNRSQPQIFATPFLSSNQTSSNVGLQGMLNNMQGGGMNMGGGGGMGMFNPLQGSGIIMQGGGMHGSMQHAPADEGNAQQNGAAWSAPNHGREGAEKEAPAERQRGKDARDAATEEKQTALGRFFSAAAASLLGGSAKDKNMVRETGDKVQMMHNQPTPHSLAGSGGFAADYDLQRGWMGGSPSPMMGAAPHSVSLNMHAMEARGSPPPMAPVMPMDARGSVGGLNGFVGTGSAGQYRSAPGMGGLNMAPPMNFVSPWWTTGGSGDERGQPVYRWTT